MRQKGEGEGEGEDDGWEIHTLGENKNMASTNPTYQKTNSTYCWMNLKSEKRSPVMYLM